MDLRRKPWLLPAYLGGCVAATGGTEAGRIWRFDASTESLAPVIGSGTPATTRAGDTATRITEAGLVETVNANLPVFDFSNAVSPDVSGFDRHAYAFPMVLPAVAGGALAGLQFDGVDVDAGLAGGAKSMGMNAGASGFGVADADGSMEVEATIRRDRTGVGETIVAVARRDGISFNWMLYVNADDFACFGMRNSAGTYVETIGTTALGTAANYTLKGRWTGTELIVSVDDVDEGTPTALTALTAPDGTGLTIGRTTWDASDATSPHPFDGVIADVSMTRGGVLQGSWPLTTLTRVAGLLSEPAATNILLHSRDLTNAAWVKGATATVAKDQTGVDGAANGASSFTGGAVSATNTVLQAVTLASSSRVASVWIKRLVGTGTIEMTTDGGTTWRNITTQVTSAYTRISIPAQTVTNPSTGFRITTNADSIAVDFVQNETGQLTSTITATGAAAVTRAASATLLALSNMGNFNNVALSVYAKTIGAIGPVLSGEFPGAWGMFTDANNYLYSYRDAPAGSNQHKFLAVTSGAIQAQPTLGPNDGGHISKHMVAVAANDYAAIVSGGSMQTDTSGTVPTVATLQIGGFNSVATQYWRGWILEMDIYNTRKTNAFMEGKVE